MSQDRTEHAESSNLQPRSGNLRFKDSEQGLSSSYQTSAPEHDFYRVRRRSSVAERINSFANAGGVNSINNFAKSWQRAANFNELKTTPHSFVIQSDDEDEGDEHRYSRDDVEHHGHSSNKSLLRAALIHGSRNVPDSPFEDETENSDESPEVIHNSERQSSGRQETLIRIDPQLTSQLGGSYGSFGGQEPSIQHNRILSQHRVTLQDHDDKETQPLLIKHIQDDDGTSLHIIVGQSTLPQTIFNSVNTLIGVGMLSLPLAIRYSGWLLGMIFFVLAAGITSYTAKLLAKCLDVDNSLITFADLAYVSFGKKARIATSLLFTIELSGCCVALVVLFATSMDAIFPGWGQTEFKVLCGVILLPLGFLPLRWLSFTSVLGIICCIVIVIAVFADGLLKPERPGSLRQPAITYLFPNHWTTLPLAFGLLMAPWGGHSVFPNIYRDMRHPHKFPKAVNYSYVASYAIEVSLAIIGYLMFGEHVQDVVTSAIFLTPGYPQALSGLIAISIAIIPLTKVPLNARPIISTIEMFCGLDARAMSVPSGMAGKSPVVRGILKMIIRILVIVMFVVVAIFIPSFDRIMSFLGNLACFTICIILPCAFHLKIFWKDLSKTQRIFDWFLIIVCSILGIVGTIASCLPKELLGAQIG